MAEDSDQEKTEPASARRIEQAREDGRVPQSRELSAFLVLLAGISVFWTLGGWMKDHATGLMRRALSFDQVQAFDQYAMMQAFLWRALDALLIVAPVFLLAMVAAVAGPLMLGGVLFSAKALTPDFKRMNPISGVGRIFSMHGVGEMIKAILKALLVGGVVYWVVSRQYGSLFAMLMQPLSGALTAFAEVVLFALLSLIAGVALIAAIDVPFQLWQYYKNLRMTREELRQEHKEQEGDPQLKGRIRSQQREIARRRMMSEVPQADVVVTNPTHFAVALKYDAARMKAPQVVAKGMNQVAARIRELAREHQVPLLEAPPLARALHRHCELEAEVPASLYTAVAEVMAYVHQLNQYRAGAPQFKEPPQQPQNLAVPSEMDPGAPDETPPLSAMQGVMA